MGNEPFEVHMEVNDLDLQPLYQKLEKFGKKTLPALVLERAVTFARYLAENTQPVVSESGLALTNDNTDQGTVDGGSLLARNIGRNAVRRDLRRVYASPSSVYEKLKNAAALGPGNQGGTVERSSGERMAKAFYAALKKNDLAGARKIVIAAGISAAQLDVVAWDNGARHRQLRNKRGRVNRSNKPQMVSDAKALKDYIKKKENMVGFSKAGWVNAGAQLTSRGMTRIRGWIKKHTSAPGTGMNLTHNEDYPRVVLTNGVPWASDVLSQKQFQRTVKQLTESLEKELRTILEKLAEAENRRTPRTAAR